VYDGLAAYFECPLATGWAGSGSVDQERLELYFAWEPDGQLSSLDSIVGGQTSQFAVSQNAKVFGVGQAWGLTHFMLEEHFDKFIEFYRKLGEMPPDLELSPAAVVAAFDQVFGSDHRKWERLEGTYMKGLKPDTHRFGDVKEKWPAGGRTPQ
jgi:hypothetical protein